MILKIHSQGPDVKQLQKLLHVTPDGIFGPITEAAVKKFQKAKGLVPGGIVTDKIREMLESGNIIINHRPIDKHVTRSPKRPIQFIAVHYTAGASSAPGSAIKTRQVFLSRAASADFVVDDQEIVQINPDLDNYYCWAVGDKRNPYSKGAKYYNMATNKNTISIEICSTLKQGFSPQYPNHEGWFYTEQALQNTIKLIRYLLDRYHLPKYRVIRHYDVSGKLCPGIIGWNDGQIYTDNGKPKGKNNSDSWNKFWAQI